MDGSGYNPPGNLINVSSTASCKADITIKVQEPQVNGTYFNYTTGKSWTGVEGVTVELFGSRNFASKTNASGVVSFSAVPCGSYRVRFSQTEFKVKNISERSITVNSSKRSGREFEFEILRQLLTVEMFRLPTQVMTSALMAVEVNKEGEDDPYGHHWIKVYQNETAATRERPTYSYGWWPLEGASPDRLWDGVPGSLNGYPVHSTAPLHDPYHTKYKRSDPKLSEVFFPYVTNGHTAKEYKDKLQAKAWEYETVSGGIWSWRSDLAGFHCKTFQTYLMRETRLWKHLGNGVGNFLWTAKT